MWVVNDKQTHEKDTSNRLGIDSMIPLPVSHDNLDIVVGVYDEKEVGKCRETPSHQHDGVSKGKGKMSQANNESGQRFNNDLREQPIISTKNKSQGRLSKMKREAI